MVALASVVDGKDVESEAMLLRRQLEGERLVSPLLGAPRPSHDSSGSVGLSRTGRLQGCDPNGVNVKKKNFSVASSDLRENDGFFRHGERVAPSAGPDTERVEEGEAPGGQDPGLHREKGLPHPGDAGTCGGKLQRLTECRRGSGRNGGRGGQSAYRLHIRPRSISRQRQMFWMVPFPLQESKDVLTRAKHARTASAHLGSHIDSALQQLVEQEALTGAANAQITEVLDRTTEPRPMEPHFLCNGNFLFFSPRCPWAP